MRIRPATADDGPAIRAIERAAGEAFRDVGMDAVADDEPPPLDVLAAHATAGRAWVATDGDGSGPVGYVLVDVVDGCAHVEQVSVHPDRQGTGIGRALLDHVEGWAAERAMPALTLTTFDAVAWNRPLYERLGFAVVDPDDAGPELQAIRAAEAAAGLDPAQRVVMRRPVGPPHPSEDSSREA